MATAGLNFVAGVDCSLQPRQPGASAIKPEGNNFATLDRTRDEDESNVCTELSTTADMCRSRNKCLHVIEGNFIMLLFKYPAMTCLRNAEQEMHTNFYFLPCKNEFNGGMIVSLLAIACPPRLL